MNNRLIVENVGKLVSMKVKFNRVIEFSGISRDILMNFTLESLSLLSTTQRDKLKSALSTELYNPGTAISHGNPQTTSFERLVNSRPVRA